MCECEGFWKGGFWVWAKLGAGTDVCNVTSRLVSLAVSVGSRVRDRRQLVVACDPELASIAVWRQGAEGLRGAARSALGRQAARTHSTRG